MSYKEKILKNNKNILNPKNIVNDRMQKVFNSNGTPADRSSYWENDYYFTTNVHTNHRNKDIVYKLNKHGFRCDNFKQVDNKKFTILYSGCSVTFGQDLPEEMIWTNLVTKELLKDKEVDAYNLSIMGGSSLLSIKNIVAFINIYGMPDLIIILLPDITRTITFDTETYKFFDLTPTTDKPDASKFIEHLMPENLLLNIFLYLNILDLLCKSNGSKLLVSTWDGLTQEYFSVFMDELDFLFETAESVPFNLHSALKDIKEGDQKYWKIAGDNKHPGGIWHKKIAEKIIEVLKFGGK